MLNGDRAVFIKHLDILSILEEGERNFAQVKEVADLDVNCDCEDVDSFSLMAARIHAIKMSWAATRPCPVTSVAEPSKMIISRCMILPWASPTMTG